MDECEEFLAETMPRLMEAEKALHNGDVAPRLAMWSHNDPVTLFGAWLSDTGWSEVSNAFERVAARFSDCTAYEIELVAAGASGDLAYTVVYEHTTACIEGTERAYTLRVTQLYRREQGEWKVVHRHGDELADAPSR